MKVLVFPLWFAGSLLVAPVVERAHRSPIRPTKHQGGSPSPRKHTPAATKMVETRNPRPQEIVFGGSFNHLAFSPDGRFLLTTILTDNPSLHAFLALWDLETGAPSLTVHHRRGFMGRAEFSPDGRTLAASMGDGKIYLWDTRSGDLKTKPPVSDPVYLDETYRIHFAFWPDGRSVAAHLELERPDRRGEVRVLDAGTGKLRRTHRLDPPPERVAFAPDGNHLIGYGNGLRLYDARTGKSQPLTSEIAKIHGVSFSPDRRVMAVYGSGERTGRDGTLQHRGGVELWDLRTRKRDRLLTGSYGWVSGEYPMTSAVFSVDSRRLWTGEWTWGGTGFLRNTLAWDLRTGKSEMMFPLAAYAPVDGWINLDWFALSPKGDLCAIRNEEGRGEIRSARTGELVATFGLVAGAAPYPETLEEGKVFWSIHTPEGFYNVHPEWKYPILYRFKEGEWVPPSVRLYHRPEKVREALLEATSTKP